MFIGPDGKLHYKYETSANDLHENRMQAIFTSRSVDGRASPRSATNNYSSQYSMSQSSYHDMTFSSMHQ